MKVLPKGWATAELGAALDRILGGGTPSKANAAHFSGSIPFMTVKDLTRRFPEDTVDHITADAAQSSSTTIVPRDTLIVATRMSLGKIARPQFETAINQDLKALFLKDGFEKGYIEFLWRSLAAHIQSLGTGTTVKGIRLDDIRTLEIPVPPTAEQKRVADKLESVLGRVDACRARLDRVPDLLKRFRQSVLAAATSGQLTEDWRSSNGAQESWLDSVKKQTVTLPAGYKRLSKQSFKPTNIEHGAGELPPTWSVQTVGQLYDLKVLMDFADGNHGSLYPRKEEFSSEGALFLTATQMDNRWGVSLDQCPRLNWTKAKQLVKGWARNSDVLLSHNATVGRVGLIEGAQEDVLLGTSVTFYRFNQHFILPRYGRIIFSSRFFQDQLESSMEQTTRDQVPITKQVSLNFICAPLAEQTEIVRRVEAVFALADRIEARLATAQRLVERLTPATLSKAFRGDLVPQDPNDEPASKLLERLAITRPSVPSRKKPLRQV